MLKRAGVAHNVLNAKQHKREAEIVEHAGQKGAVTIATNMAGRGTDIKLGAGVREAGGLYIIGTERHESRRIDRQLRGRSGRQGDPGTSKFFLSLEDDLMRLFGNDRIANVMERMGFKEGDVIEHKMITRSVEKAQKRVEENNFAIRKRLLEYDNVMNQQREVIYRKRNRVLEGERMKGEIFDDLNDYIAEIVEEHYDNAEIIALQDKVMRNLLVEIKFTPDEWEKLGADGVTDEIIKKAKSFYQQKEDMLGSEIMAKIERFAFLSVIDNKWKEHLREMDDLKEGIGLRAYAQKDPLVEYKTEAFQLFSNLLDQVRDESIQYSFKFFPKEPESMQSERAASRSRMVETKQESTNLGLKGGGGEGGPPRKQQTIRVGQKVGRNDPCPCGSGKKYKHCHGK
jgi:preprotein translocase subunit SecA